MIIGWIFLSDIDSETKGGLYYCMSIVWQIVSNSEGDDSTGR